MFFLTLRTVTKKVRHLVHWEAREQKKNKNSICHVRRGWKVIFSSLWFSVNFFFFSPFFLFFLPTSCSKILFDCSLDFYGIIFFSFQHYTSWINHFHKSISYIAILLLVTIREVVFKCNDPDNYAVNHSHALFSPFMVHRTLIAMTCELLLSHSLSLYSLKV